MKTHKVLDTIYHEDEGQECFDGTYKECIDFVSEQNSFGLEVVPMTKEEIEAHPDNIKDMKTKKQELYKMTSELPMAGKGEIHTKKEWKRIFGYDVGLVAGVKWEPIEKLSDADILDRYNRLDQIIKNA